MATQTNQNSEGISQAAKLGPIMLTAIVISSMIGGGTYSIPQSMAQNGVPAAIVLAWLVTIPGMFFIAGTFKILSREKPELKTGIYAYSKAGFGVFAGFNIAWAYWICQIFSNVGSLVLMMDAMNYFFPGKFTGGNNLNSLIAGSAIIWALFLIVRNGLQGASLMNLIGTVCKILPIIIFTVLVVYYFDLNKFLGDFSGQTAADNTKNLGGIGAQAKHLMIYAMWVFVGVESASVMSGHARSQRDVGIATLTGFFCSACICMTVSLLPFGIMTQAELAHTPNPSTAGVLKATVGAWGEIMMNVGLVISLCVSMLSWTMISIQLPFAAASDSTFPKIFTKRNKNGVPIVSLAATAIFTQIIFITVHFAANAWNIIFSIASVLILPAYFASALYLLKISLPGRKIFPICCGLFGSVYALWVMSTGITYLLLATVFLVIGIPVFLWARRENKSAPTRLQIFLMVCIVAFGALAVGLWAGGSINLLG